MRATRGGTMAVGRRNEVPDAQVMFCIGVGVEHVVEVEERRDRQPARR